MSQPFMQMMKKIITFIILGTVFILIIVSIMVTSNYAYSQNVKRWTEEIKGEQLMYIMSYEHASFQEGLPEGFAPPSFSALAFELLTNIDLGDTRTLLGRELPGLALFDTRIIVPGDGTNLSNIPFESAPPLEVLLEDLEAIEGPAEHEDQQDQSIAEIDTPSPIQEDVHVLIHHSHSWESFLPHLPGVIDPDLAIHNELNITNVGENLGNELIKRGIHAEVDSTNMTENLHSRNMKWHHAYSLSREIVKSRVQENQGINYIFDLHRDSQRQDVTTVTINNETYARIFFVIGESHPDYEKNLSLATELHYRIEETYPGLSRGIFGKDTSDGNGIYNQDLMANSILIEFGGVDNHIEELYRSTEAFAEVFHLFLEEKEKHHE